METLKQTSKSYFMALTVMHLALVGGIVFFGGIMTFLVTNLAVSAEMRGLETTFLYIVCIFFVFGIISSFVIYRKRVGDLTNQQDLTSKMTGYRGAFIVRLALLEGPAFFAIVVAFLTGNLLFLVFAGIIAVYMIYLRPSKETVARDLGLNYDEIAKIQNPEYLIAEITPRN
jgi:hypothetical protein